VDKFLIFGITGLVLAAIYAVIASGLVLTYTTTGIFNFAHGATGMLAAFAYWQLRFAWDWPAPIALFVVLVLLAPGFGLLLERYVMRGLHDTSDTVRLVVTIALLSGLIAFAPLDLGPERARPMRKFFASADPWPSGRRASPCTSSSPWPSAIAVAVGLRVLLYRTRAGRDHAGDGRRPAPGRAQRVAARPVRPRGLGPGLLAGRPRGCPHRPQRRPRRRGPVAAHRQRLRRRHLRPPAQHPHDVRGAIVGRLHRELPHRLPADQRLPPGLRWPHRR
jgi:hypothetical protein